MDFHNFCQEQFLKHDDYYNPELSAKIEDHGYPTFVQFFDDGTYTDAYMSLKNERVAFKNIKIFASKD